MSGAVREADAATRAALLDLEERRQQALLAVDVAALDAMFDDALVHIHAPGVTHTKAQLLEHVATRKTYQAISRDELRIRLIGDDVAVITGRITNHLGSENGQDRVLSGTVTQVAHREGDAWKFVSFQMTPDGEQAWGKLPSEQEQA